MRSVSFPLFLGLVLAACSKAGSDGGGETGDTTSPPVPPTEVFFQSGFGPGVEAQDNGTGPCSADLTGSDGLERSDWVEDLEASPVDNSKFCFGGDDDYSPVEQRSIRLAPDPDDPANQVLYTWVKEPAENFEDKSTGSPKDADDVPCSCEAGLDKNGEECEGAPVDETGTPLDGYDVSGTRKGRVQMALFAEENTPYTKVDYSVRLRLGESFQTLNDSFPLQLEWMTIGEYWNEIRDESGAITDRARITLNMVKESASADFHFGLKMDIQPEGTSGWDCVWPECSNGQEEHLLSPSPVPLGEWFTLKVSLVAGDASTGRTVVDLVDNSGESSTLFDVSDTTLDPDSPVQGFTNIAAIKLYTAGNVVCWLKNQGLALDAHWDDFTLSFE